MTEAGSARRSKQHARWGWVGGRLLAALGLAMCGIPAARAAPPSEATEATSERVLIRVIPGDERIAARLRAELDLLGLSPIDADFAVETPALGPDLLDLLGLSQATAAIEIVIVDDTRIDLWVADGDTGKTLNRRLDLGLDPALADPRTVAIAAVELLRASRLELAEPVDPIPATDPDDPFAESEDPRDSPLRGAISLAPLIGGSPGGFGVTTHIELAGRWAPLDRFALRVSAWIPTVGNTVEVTGGSVRMFVGMVFVEPQLRLPGGATWFKPELGLGLGGAVVGFAGIANEGLRSDTQIVGGFAGHTHLGLGFAVIPRLWIRLDGYVGLLQPRPEIESSTGEVEATWGLPFANGSLGLEIWL